ncbi:MAG: segregation/condensation protein A [Firmicutes bacterium]|nr:segregation/condensation protein A [Bacillota bacterium]
MDKILIDNQFEEDFFDAEEGFNSTIFKLKDFDGPLDILIHLIKGKKLSIQDVKISDITEQYLEYMKEIDELDLDKATDFIQMAAWLLEIKTKTLLPKPVVVEEIEDDPEKALKQRLEEYTLFKQASQKMKEIETVDIHYREPDDSVGKPKFILKQMDLNGLMSALQKVFLRLGERAEEIKERHIVKDRFTVEEKIGHIKDVFLFNDTYSFFNLFDANYSKSEVISTFQALLELLKMQHIKAIQDEIFGDIILKKAASEEEEENINEY